MTVLTLRSCVLLVVLALSGACLAQESPTPKRVKPAIPSQDYTGAELALLQELEQRRVDIDRREKALELRERLVDLAEERLAERVNKLTDLKKDIELLLKNLSDKEDDELEQLAKIYESMKPASAAAVLDQMENKIVYDLFKRMKKKNTAKIMEKMSTVKARIISEMLAEKSELPAFE